MTTSQKRESQDAVRAWLRTLLESRNWTPSQLAARAGISKSTVSRAFHDDSFVTTTTTLAKIAAAAGIPAPRIGLGLATGFGEEDLRPIEPPAAPAPTANQFWREVGSAGLVVLGILPGDAVLIDMAATPWRGAVVCAQLYDHEHGTARTVLRQYEPPFLQTRALEASAHRKPDLVDGTNVKIMGVVVQLKRRLGPPEGR